MPDTQHINLAKSVLKSILGLSPKTIKRVISIIQASPDIAELKNQMIRRRIGPRSMDYLKRAITLSGEGGSVREDKNKKEDKKTESKEDKKEDKKNAKLVKDELEEGLTFKKFLIEISAEQAARMSVTDQQARKQAAMKTDRDVTKDLAKNISDMEQSADPDEKKLAMLMKQEAILRQRIKNKKAKESQATI